MIDSTELGIKLIDILRNIKTMNENSVFEFKVEPHKKEHDCELIKDILGLANSLDRPKEDRWLIYGVNIKDHVLIGVDNENPNLLDDANFQQKLNKIFPEIHIEFITIPANSVREGFDLGKVFAAFYIPCECVSCVHECGEMVVDKEPDKQGRVHCLYPGTSFVRIGSSTTSLLESHREKIRALATAKVEQMYHFIGSSFSDGNYTRGDDALLLLGSWDESNESDKKLIGELCGDAYCNVIKEIQPMLDDGVFKMSNSCWCIQDRMDSIARVGQHLTNTALLDLSLPIGKMIFSVDDAFSLPVKDRDTADLRGVSRGASKTIRNGAASLCAIIGTHPELLPQCKSDDIERFLIGVMRVGFDSGDWRMLASADEHMSLLAEASPSIFLSFVEAGLKKDAIPQMLREKSGGIFAFGLGSGLIYGIRIAALDDNTLSKVIPILVEISNYTDIGNSAIVDLLLPWYPSTPASVESRIGASRFLARCSEKAAWDSLIALLPNNTTSSIGVVEPQFMTRPDLPESVSYEEYWHLSREYCTQVLCGASGNIDHLRDVVSNVASFKHAGMLDEMCAFVRRECKPLISSERYHIWSKLLSYVERCKKFCEADWALKGESLHKLEDLTVEMQPKDEFYTALRYCTINDCDFIDKGESYSDGAARVRSLRASVLEGLYKDRGLSFVDDLIDRGASGYAIGNALAFLSISEEEQRDIVARLDEENADDEQSKFIRSYIGAMFANKGQSWIDSQSIESWDASRKAKFFSCLPLQRDVWERAEEALGEDSVRFWQEVPSFYPLENAQDVDYCARRFIGAGRADVTIDMLSMALHQKLAIKSSLVKEALKGLRATQFDTMLSYHIESLLGYLRDVEPNGELFALELQYATVLSGGSDLYMYKRMAYDPEAYLGVVSLVFDLEIEGKWDLQLSDEARAAIYYKALQEWKIAPGTSEEGEFSEDMFRAWIDFIQKSTNDDRSQTVLSHQAGRACFYSPSYNGLFIPDVVAEYLDSHEDALSGFEMECFNSRGFHWVDKTGATEDELADEYEKKANTVEARGYLNLASSLRRTAKSYRKEAEHNREDCW